MIKEFITRAKAGEPVYINDVHDYFQGMAEGESQVMHCRLSLLEEGKMRDFPLRVPAGISGEEGEFVKEYVLAELYNILSSLGGRRMDVYVDGEETAELARELNGLFGIDLSRKDRRGYGRAVNVTDRMLATLAPGERGFRFHVHPLGELPVLTKKEKTGAKNLDVYRRVTENMEGKLFCGIDVGGTDIKIALVRDGEVSCYKEYDWFPAQFTKSIQLVEPILLIVRLMRAKASLDIASDSTLRRELAQKMSRALDINASEEFMASLCNEIEAFAGDGLAQIDGVGMCFPDVVVRNKIVGGEVYKTRGIRNNPVIDYEKDFLDLTNLNDRIGALIKKDCPVLIINDGPMASFTAAVEVAASDKPEIIRDGVFAHTLGTELGTGWVTEEGTIPDIPLEVYNYIIDLGSRPERAFGPDDLRSVNNFNTDLPGTLQKYTSQSGAFRLAMKYFPGERPDLFKELRDKGFVVEEERGGRKGYFVPTAPKDMRKPFLEHMMSLPEREGDEVCERIWKEIGGFLAVTWIETEKILEPAAQSRVLFGRLVKRPRCYELMCRGAEEIRKGIRFDVADSTLANTPLMKQLEADEHFTVAQFAQAIGAAYFANQNGL